MHDEYHLARLKTPVVFLQVNCDAYKIENMHSKGVSKMLLYVCWV